MVQIKYLSESGVVGRPHPGGRFWLVDPVLWCLAVLPYSIDLTELLLRNKHNVLQDPSKGRDFQAKHGLKECEKVTLQSFAQSCLLKILRKALNTPKRPLRHCSFEFKQKADYEIGGFFFTAYQSSILSFAKASATAATCDLDSQSVFLVSHSQSVLNSVRLSITNLRCGCACVFTSWGDLSDDNLKTENARCSLNFPCSMSHWKNNMICIINIYI
jgi:hypothetical protein